MQQIYEITDTTIQETLDKVPQKNCHNNEFIYNLSCEKSDYSLIQRVLGGHLTASLDATDTFCSCKTRCESCLVKILRNEKKYIIIIFFTLLTLLAFLVDQITQHFDLYFKCVWVKFISKKFTWIKIRKVFNQLPCASMNVVYLFLLNELTINLPLLEWHINISYKPRIAGGLLNLYLSLAQ